MTLHAPSYAGGFASPERGLIDRSLWDGVVGAWAPSLGATGLTLRDHSGKANHGTLTNATLATAWADPRGITLTTGTDYVNVAQTDWAFPADFAVSLWVNFTTYNGYQNVISTTRDGNANGGFWMEFGSARGYTTYSNGVLLLSDTVSIKALNTGQWYHVAMTRKGSALSLWLDAAEIGSNATTATVGDTTNPLLVGKYSVADTTSALDGMVDDIVVYSGRGLTAAEVADLHRLGRGGIYRRQLQYNAKAPSAGRINSLVGVGGGMIGYGGGMIGRGY